MHAPLHKTCKEIPKFQDKKSVGFLGFRERDFRKVLTPSPPAQSRLFAIAYIFSKIRGKILRAAAALCVQGISDP